MLFAVGEESVLPTRALTPVLTQSAFRLQLKPLNPLARSAAGNLSLQGGLGIVFRTQFARGTVSDGPIVRIRLHPRRLLSRRRQRPIRPGSLTHSDRHRHRGEDQYRATCRAE